MKIFAPLILTVALGFQAVAQNLSTAPVSSSLRSRLRAQIRALAPQLQPQGFPVDANSLALPAAQLGDFDLALRLAKEPSVRDGLGQWRVAQLADAGKYEMAFEAAKAIRNGPFRADALLLIARRAVDGGQIESAARAMNAFSVLKNAALRDQLAYGGYLWARANQPEAARRLWKRAWPALLREQQIRSKDDFKTRRQIVTRLAKEPGKAPQRVEDEETLDQIKAQAAARLVPFMAHAGMMRDVLPYLSFADAHDYSFRFGSVVMLARTPSQRQILRDWLAAHEGPTALENWEMLAVAESFGGDQKQARADYARATAVRGTQEKTGAETISAVILANAWNDEALRLDAEAKLRAAFKPGKGPEDADEIIVAYRLMSFGHSGFTLRPDVSREQLLGATDLLIASSSRASNRNVLNSVAYEWQKRGDNFQLLRIARKMVEKGRAKSKRENATRTGEWEPFWSGGAELGGAVWLRKAGQNEEAQVVAREFARTTPARFRPVAAMKLWQSGFSKVADSTFDPVAELRHQQLLQKARQARFEVARRAGKEPPHESVDFSIFSGWGALAQTQARFVSPDAPARWFGKLPSPQLKAQVLAAWIEALSPTTRNETPFVRHIASAHGSSGSSSR